MAARRHYAQCANGDCHSCDACEENAIEASGEIQEEIRSIDPDNCDANVIVRRVVDRTGLPESIVRTVAKNVLAVQRTMNSIYKKSWADADVHLNAMTKVLRAIADGNLIRNIQQYMNRSVRNERIDSYRRSLQISFGSRPMEKAKPDTSSLPPPGRISAQWLRDHGFPTLAMKLKYPDMNQKQLADLLKLHPSTVSRRLHAEMKRIAFYKDRFDTL